MAFTPNIISGPIPFGPGGNPLQGLASGGLQGLANQYQTGYNSALAQNQAMYQNIMGGYQQTQAQQTDAANAIAGGYSNLYNNVLGGIQGIDASQRQAINDAYAQQSGAATQSLISRGLGNTTVQDSIQRGLLLDKMKADIGLSNQTAQLQAGYMSQLGLAGLDYANQANMQGTGLSARQLDFMNTVTAKYPNQADYYNLFDASGRYKQMQQDQAALKNSQRGGFGFAGGMSAGYSGRGGAGSSGSGAGSGYGPARLGGGVNYQNPYDSYGGGGLSYTTPYGGNFGSMQEAQNYLAGLNDPGQLSTAGTMYMPGYDPSYYDLGIGSAQGPYEGTGEGEISYPDTSYIDQELQNIYGTGNYSQADADMYSGLDEYGLTPDDYSDRGSVDLTDTGYYDEWF